MLTDVTWLSTVPMDALNEYSNETKILKLATLLTAVHKSSSRMFNIPKKKHNAIPDSVCPVKFCCIGCISSNAGKLASCASAHVLP